MATYTATACQTNASGFFLHPPKYNEKGVQCITAQFTFTAAQSAGDVFQMVPIAKGAVIHDVFVSTTGFTGGLATLGIGDGSSTKRFGSASISANVSVRPNQAAIGYSYSVDDTIDLLIDAVSTATATGTIRLSVFFSFDQAQDGNAGSN